MRDTNLTQIDGNPQYPISTQAVPISILKTLIIARQARVQENILQAFTTS